MKKYFRDESGFSLVTVFMVGVILILVSIASATLLTQQNQQTKNFKRTNNEESIVEYVLKSIDCCQILQPAISSIPQFNGSDTSTSPVSCGVIMNELSSDPNWENAHDGVESKFSARPLNRNGNLFASFQATVGTSDPAYRDIGYYIGREHFSLHCDDVSFSQKGLYLYVWRGQTGSGIKDPLTNNDISIPYLAHDEPLCTNLLKSGDNANGFCNFGVGTPTFTPVP